MSDDNNPFAKRDAQLTAIYSPRDQPDFTNVIGITSQVINTGVVRDTDWDDMQRAAAAQRTPVVAPSAPPSNPGAPSVDLASARTGTGERIADLANLNADSIVTFSGMETTLGVLLEMGLVARDPTSGLFRASASESSQEQQPQQEVPQQNAPLDDYSEAVLSDVMARAPSTVTGAVSSFISGDGVMPDESVYQLAADLGLEPEAAREQIAHISDAFAKEAVQLGAKAVGTSEVIAMEALEWARTTQPFDLREAAQRHFNEGRADYGTFVRDYVSSMDQRDPQRILTANAVPGRRVHYDRASQQVLVTLNDGTEMSWEAAVRGRFISIN